jgi:hypothetical protein
MAIFNHVLDKTTEDKVFSDLQKTGLACLENVIDADFLKQARSEVERQLEARGEKYFSLIQPWKNREFHVFREIGTDSAFLELMKNLSRRGHSEDAVEDYELYNVLRVIAGPETATKAFQFHYDATVLTVLMPLFIPGGAPDKAGDLVALPNHRPYRRSSVVNLIEKALLQNPLANRLYKRRYGSGLHDVLKLAPGNLYFFWGYRTLHGNLPAEANKRRATLLFHYGDPHRGSIVTKTILKLKWLREKARGNTYDAA